MTYLYRLSTEWLHRFARILFPWNFAYVKLCENKTLVKISKFPNLQYDKWVKQSYYTELAALSSKKSLTSPSCPNDYGR